MYAQCRLKIVLVTVNVRQSDSELYVVDTMQKQVLGKI